MSEKVQISENTSKRLFLSFLINSKEDKIESLIDSLKIIVKNKANNKLAYLNTLEYKLRHIRDIKIVKQIEEEKAKLN